MAAEQTLETMMVVRCPQCWARLIDERAVVGNYLYFQRVPALCACGARWVFLEETFTVTRWKAD